MTRARTAFDVGSSRNIDPVKLRLIEAILGTARTLRQPSRRRSAVIPVMRTAWPL